MRDVRQIERLFATESSEKRFRSDFLSHIAHFLLRFVTHLAFFTHRCAPPIAHSQLRLILRPFPGFLEVFHGFISRVGKGGPSRPVPVSQLWRLGRELWRLGKPGLSKTVGWCLNSGRRIATERRRRRGATGHRDVSALREKGQI